MPNDEFIITASLNNVVVLLKSETVITLNCIGCGKCADICPVKLTPTLIKKAYDKNKLSTLESLNTTKCVRCGLCSYICPSRVDVSETVGLAKDLLVESKNVRVEQKK